MAGFGSRGLVVLFSAAAMWGAEKKVSVADCRYAIHPDEFLERATRVRRDVLQHAARLNRSAYRSAAPVAPAEIPRRNFIDQEIFGRLAKQGLPSAPLSSDEEFVRRIHLDLTGRIPPSDDVRAFLAASGDSKRDALIDRLLESPEFTDRWTLWAGDLLQNTSRLVNAAVNRNAQGRNAFHAYIRESVSQDKSLRDIAIEVITGKGNNYEASNGAANFPLGASTSMGPIQDTYDTMLVKTASTFLGLGSYDCLLCHGGRGHLEQMSLWGTRQTRAQAQSMAAFFSRMNFGPGPGGSFVVSESSSGGYELNTDSGNRPARAPLTGSPTMAPAYRETGTTPSGSDWRAAFAENMVQDPMFARNLANRIWRQMFGLALVDPVDGLDPARLDPSQPPPAPWELQASHPELLERLAAELVVQDFKLRAFVRTLVRSSAYQLSSRVDGGWSEGTSPLFARHYARRLEGEEVHDAIAKATGVPGEYAVQGWADRVAWAVQLPEPAEPAGSASVRNFLDTFLRGNRDTQERAQSGSIQQQLYLMNDQFVLQRVRASRSPKVKEIAQIANQTELVDELYLTFLSRRPSDAERTTALAALGKAASGASREAVVEDLAWMCINKVEFLYSY